MGAFGIDVSALSVSEMRRLIAQAEARGQTALARQLESELDWRQRSALEPQADTAADANADTPTPTAAARSGSARIWQLAAAALAGAVVAGAAGWWLTWAGFGPRPAPGRTAEIAKTAPPPVGPPAPASAPATATEALSPPAATQVPAAAASQAAAHAPAPSSPAGHRPAACRAPATPGQRTVCASPRLLAQDQRMLRAYERALAAGANRLALDRGQAQWRQVRNRTASPERLAQLYRTRIAALDAAARQARAHGAGRHARHHPGR